MKNIFALDGTYKEQIKKYDYKDGLLAIALFLIFAVVLALLGLYDKHTETTIIESRLIGTAANFLLGIIVIVFLKLRKQSLSTIGLKGGRIKLSFILGGCLAVVLIFFNCVSNILFCGYHFVEIQQIIVNLLFFLSVGFGEEVVFRGYIGTRIYAFTKNIPIALIVTGLLFLLMHFPYRMAAYDISIISLLTNVRYMADLFITHCILSYIYLKTNSIYGSILPHWMSDLAYGMVTLK